MKNDREMMQALLDGEILTTKRGTEWRLGNDNVMIRPDGIIPFPYYYDVEIKPKTIKINGFEVPDPLREAPEKGVMCYVASTGSVCSVPYLVWSGCDLDIRWLSNGVLHSTQEAAKKHIDAMLSFTRTGQ